MKFDWLDSDELTIDSLAIGDNGSQTANYGGGFVLNTYSGGGKWMCSARDSGVVFDGIDSSDCELAFSASV